MKKNIYLIISIIWLISCAVGRGGFYYKVKSGDTLNIIAHKYDLNTRTLVRANNLSSSLIKINQLLYIPVPKKNISIKKTKINKHKNNKTNNNKVFKKHHYKKYVFKKPDIKSKNVFDWPVKGKIISYFSKKTRGIDILTSNDLPVKSIDEGKIIFAKELKGYGNTVIVNHTNAGFVSVYSYLKTINVNLNDLINKSQTIGMSGITKESKYNQPVLHFEIRKTSAGNPIAVNPLLLLKK